MKNVAASSKLSRLRSFLLGLLMVFMSFGLLTSCQSVDANQFFLDNEALSNSLSCEYDIWSDQTTVTYTTTVNNGTIYDCVGVEMTFDLYYVEEKVDTSSYTYEFSLRRGSSQTFQFDFQHEGEITRAQFSYLVVEYKSFLTTYYIWMIVTAAVAVVLLIIYAILVNNLDDDNPVFYVIAAVIVAGGVATSFIISTWVSAAIIGIGVLVTFLVGLFIKVKIG